MKFKCIIFLLLMCMKNCYSEIIEIDDGKIEGTMMTSRLGQAFHAFLQIPFAQAPTGSLRFQPPRPAKQWQGIRNATFYGPMCMQVKARFDFEMLEDCLHLNVYTKNLPSKENSILKPVIVFIHGGAWEIGTSVDQGPHILMDRDVIVVTMNYRLGAFGFLAVGTSEAVGNAGLKDQVMALQWVQKNINRFGGDPKRVTISGISAGGHSVTALMISPLAYGLFSNAISMSGSIAWQMPFQTEYLSVARHLAKKLNCTIDDDDDMVQCLKKKPAEEIGNIRPNDYPECAIFTWFPVIEPDLGQERFFVEDPLISIRKGNFMKVPLIIGRTDMEFIDIAARMSNRQLLQLNDNFEHVAPHCFFYEANSPKSILISKELRKFYLPFESIDKRSIDNLSNLFGDGYIGYGVHRFVHLISNFTDVYYYKFKYIGRFSVFLYPHDKPYGVHHADDLQYVIYADQTKDLIKRTDPEDITIERMTRIWEQFARTGNPNNKSDEYLKEMNWPKHNSDTEYYLEIGQNLVEKNGMFLERYALWDKLETSSSSGTKLKSSVNFFFLISISFFILFLIRTTNTSDT